VCEPTLVERATGGYAAGSRKFADFSGRTVRAAEAVPASSGFFDFAKRDEAVLGEV